MQSLETCPLVINDFCKKPVSLLELQTIFDVSFLSTSEAIFVGSSSCLVAN